MIDASNVLNVSPGALFAEHERAGFTTRACTVLLDNCPSIRTVDDLVALSPRQLLRRKNCGRKTVRYIRWVLGQYGLTLSGDGPVDDANEYAQQLAWGAPA